MALWGAEVKAGEDYVHKFSLSHRRLRITQATLGDLNTSGWSVLESNAGEERRAVLCVLNPSNHPMHRLEIELEEDVDITFSVKGQSSIYLSGYYILTNPNTCTTKRNSLGKRKYDQEISDRSRNHQKAAHGKNVHEDKVGKTCEDTKDDGSKKMYATPPPSRNKNKFVGKPSGVPEDIVYLQDSDDDDEKETNLEHKESDKLGIECIFEGQAGAKIATLGSKVKVEYIGHSKDGKFIDHGDHYQFKLGKRLIKLSSDTLVTSF
ncbi:peptidyl-prolyl cis-trans isomerase FKBP53-like [Triticum aestivum]|uniref:peptidyl-prolyl cis-trans isomerase FKBP53-like n=1 Tax=Triticum aestivum TaxID=4565 RepID=UPI001D01E60B|nr:peptidyl-prolyl cis-trans isomerase FKBP53-like [Triticum aestivum]